MKPVGTPVASVILSGMELALLYEDTEPYLWISGSGVLAPAVVIPNAWWDRPRLIDRLDVDRPRMGDDGLLILEFRGRCDRVVEMQKVFAAGRREEIEREIVPAVLAGLTTARWNVADARPLEPVSRPFGTPIDADGPAPPHVAQAPGPPPGPPAPPPGRRPRVRIIDT
jgi:hypothetical protein